MIKTKKLLGQIYDQILLIRYKNEITEFLS